MGPKHDNDNHANQMNPNNDAYWESRGCDERPDDWKDRVETEEEEVLERQSTSVGLSRTAY